MRGAGRWAGTDLRVAARHVGGDSRSAGFDPALAPEVRIETVAGVAMDLTEGVMWVAPDVPARVAFAAVPL
jgi:hypothetical protein